MADDVDATTGMFENGSLVGFVKASRRGALDFRCNDFARYSLSCFL